MLAARPTGDCSNNGGHSFTDAGGHFSLSDMLVGIRGRLWKWI